MAELSTLLAALLALDRILLAPLLAVDAALVADSRMEDAAAEADEPIAEPELLALDTDSTREDCWGRALAVLMSLAAEVPGPTADTRSGANSRTAVVVNFMVLIEVCRVYI